MTDETKTRGRPRGSMSLDRKKMALTRAINAGIRLLRDSDPGVRLGAIHATIQGVQALERLDRPKFTNYRHQASRPTESFTKLPPEIEQVLEAAADRTHSRTKG
jgi:hypothetical protein